GVILGISEAPQNVSFPAMAERQQALGRVILKDPAVSGLSSFIGIDGTNVTLNSGRILINLKALAERDGVTEVIDRLRAALAEVAGIALYLQPVQDLTVEDRVSRTQFQYSLEDADEKELRLWAPRLVARLREQPVLRDVASVEERAAPLMIAHQGQFPAVTISFNLAPGASLGDAVDAINGAAREINLPPAIQTGFLGAARAFQASLANEPILILAAV